MRQLRQVSAPGQCASRTGQCASSVWLFACQHTNGVRQQVYDRSQAFQGPLGRTWQVDDKGTPSHTGHAS